MTVNLSNWIYRTIAFILTVIFSQDLLPGQFIASSISKHISAVRFNVKEYDYSMNNKVIHDRSYHLNINDQENFARDRNATWNIQLSAGPIVTSEKGYNVNADCYLLEGTADQSKVSIELVFDDWSTDNYVLLPAAAYNGNRFPFRRIRYSPKLLNPWDIGPDKGIIISDVPRLNIHSGPSKIEERSGSMSVPAIGFYSPEKKEGFWLLTDQANSWGDLGITIEESRDRKTAVISVTSPVVREKYKYRITDNMYPSDDQPADFRKGDHISIPFNLYFFKGDDLQSLFSAFLDIRKDRVKDHPVVPSIPLSECFDVIEDKFNRQNWEPTYHYYSVGLRENFLQDWQIGWTGGMISTYALLWGSDQSRESVIQTFDWLFPDGISPSGFFWDSGESDENGMHWYGGDIRRPHTASWHLVRKSGDGLYYVLKQLSLMDKAGMDVKNEWEKGTRQVADAFVKLWNDNHQLGQFIHNETGEIIVGGSTSGAIVPAALVLAGRYFGEPDYIRTAEEIAGYFYDTYIYNGITCGGPGDALQNPDSESGYAMLESFSVLFEETRDAKWLKASEHMAALFATWVMGYDYKFPEQSTFGKLGIKTTGAVFANTQNKHASPGICTHSGIALFRQMRATGFEGYGKLLSEITTGFPQYLSHPDKPIAKLQHGWVNERVNTTDWLEPVGEIFPGSTWSETALMLTWVELPGVYVMTDRAKVFEFDQVNAEITDAEKDQLTVRITNPTGYIARVRVFAENQDDREKPLYENYLWDQEMVILEPGGEKIITFPRK